MTSKILQQTTIFARAASSTGILEDDAYIHGIEKPNKLALTPLQPPKAETGAEESGFCKSTQVL